jgi:aryl-alcohol dehydrogenase-like predicted oxidoreductase
MKSLSVSERYGWARYVAHQAYYSLLDREFEWELMPAGIDQKVSTIVWSPLSSGLLGGKYRRNQPFPEDSRRQQGGSHGPTPDYERLYKIMDVLDAIAQETGKSVAQVAINWLLQRPTVANIVIGARNEEQLKQNLGATGWKLTIDQVKTLDQAGEVAPVYPYWHQRQDTRLNPLPKFY